jgi:gamma-glutamyl:cysteine ligase YbdK (ATP-grasp superfamily)
MARPRAADDFAAIRARMEELRRERSQAAPDHEIHLNSAGRYPRNRANEQVRRLELRPFRDQGRSP